MIYHTKSFEENIRYRDAIREWLQEGSFTHFITLASNDPTISYERMKDRLSAWDARMNRWLVGPKWHHHRDERMNWIAIMEKPKINPHWHILMRIEPEQITKRETSNSEMTSFDQKAVTVWKKVLPSGSVDAQSVASKSVIEYSSKDLWCERNQELFLTHKDFIGD